jgi:hypoxanthine phosphoribosyltransferase
MNERELTQLQEVRRSARVLYSAREIESAIAKMAAAAAPVLIDQNPVVLPVLLGGLFTAVRLCAYFDFPYELDRLEAGRYGHSESGGEVEWRVLPALQLQKRTVLVVDDVLDRGVTLAAVHSMLERVGVAAIYTAVLVDKQTVPPLPRPTVDFVGVQAGSEYLFGCGMDYRGYWRGLPELLAVVPK